MPADNFQIAPERGEAKAAAQPVAWLRDAHEGEGDECLVPAAKGDQGAFPVYAEPAAPDLLEALKAVLAEEMIYTGAIVETLEKSGQHPELTAKILAAIQRAGSEQ